MILTGFFFSPPSAKRMRQTRENPFPFFFFHYSVARPIDGTAVLDQ